MSKETMRDYTKVPIPNMTLQEAYLFCKEHSSNCDNCIMCKQDGTGCMLNFPKNWNTPSMSIHDKLIIDFFINLGAKWMVKPKSTDLMIHFWKVHPDDTECVASDEVGTIYYDVMAYTRGTGAFILDLTKLY